MISKYLLVLFILICGVSTSSALDTEIPKDTVLEKSSSYLQPTVPPTKCNYGVCPLVKDAFITKIKNVDFQSGTTYCYVYNKTDNKLLATIKEVNEICKDTRVLEKRAISTVFKNMESEANKDKQLNKGFLGIKEQKDFYFGTYIDTGDKEFLNASKYMIAGLTLDNKIININESVNKNRVVLQDDYTMFPNASTNYQDESILHSIKAFFNFVKEEKNAKELSQDKDTRLVSQASQLLSGITVFIMHFMGDYNSIMLSLKAFLVFTIVPFTGFFLIQSKLTKRLSDQQDYDDVFERIFYTILTLFVFYFSTSNIKINNMNFNEETKISQSNFQNWFRTIFYEGADFATEVARVGTTSYLKYKVQDIGAVSKEVLRNSKIEKELLEKEQAKIFNKEHGLLANCYKIFNTELLKQDMGLYSTFNTTFPNSETMMIKDGALGERSINWYSSGSYVKEGYENAPYSANGCYNLERLFLNNKAKIEDLERDISIYTKVSDNDTINNQIDILTKTQYRSSAELGWIGFSMIPTLNIAINELEIIDKSARNDTNEAKKEQIEDDTENTNKLDKGIGAKGAKALASVVGGIAYMMLPGANDLFQVLSRGGKTVVEAVTDAIPFLGGIVGGLVGKLAVSIIAIVLSIAIMKFLVVILPLVGIIMASVMVIAYYFISVELYYIVSPFIIAFALSAQQGDVIKKFLKIGVTLALKPVMIVLSLVMAIWVFEFFNVFNDVLVDWNFDSIFAVSDTGGVQVMSTFYLTIAREFIHIGIQIVSFFVVFYMVLNGANMIMDMFGLSDANVDVQSAIGSNIDNKSAKWNNGGV